jgi:hypothetical protein
MLEKPTMMANSVVLSALLLSCAAVAALGESL